VDSGRLTPHIDRAFALAYVPAALAYLVRGGAKGKIVVAI
jgi:NADPH:quinone reductase-like Zn-dependent oxidoreductase